MSCTSSKYDILVTLLKMQPHYSQSSRENATPSSGTSPLASYKGSTPPGSKSYVIVMVCIGIVVSCSCKDVVSQNHTFDLCRQLVSESLDQKPAFLKG